MSRRNLLNTYFILFSGFACVALNAQSHGVELLRHDLSFYPNGRLYPDTTLHGVEEGLSALNQECKTKSIKSPEPYVSKLQARVTLYQYYGLPSEVEYVEATPDTIGGKYMGMTYDSLVIIRALAVFNAAKSNSAIKQIYFVDLYTDEGNIGDGRLFANSTTYTNLSGYYRSYPPSFYPNTWRKPSIEVLILDSLPHHQMLPTKYRKSLSYSTCLYDERVDEFDLAGTYKIDIFPDSYYKRFSEIIAEWNRTFHPNEELRELKYDKRLERFEQLIDSIPPVAQAYYLALGEAINGNLLLTTGISIKPDYLFTKLVDQRENFEHRLKVLQRAVSWPSCGGGGGGIDGRMWYYRKPIAMLAGATGKHRLFINAHLALLKNQAGYIAPKRLGISSGGYLDESKSLGLDVTALLLSNVLDWQKQKIFPYNDLNFEFIAKLANSDNRFEYLDLLINLIKDSELDDYNRLQAYRIAKQLIKTMKYIQMPQDEAESAETKIAELLPIWLNK